MSDDHIQFPPDIELLLDNGCLITCNRMFVDGWPIMEVSGSIESVCRYQASEIEERAVDFISLIHPEDQERVVNELEAQVDGDVFSLSPYRITKDNGKYCWVQETGVFTHNKKNSVICFSGIITPVSMITDLKDEINLLKKKIVSINNKCKANDAVSFCQNEPVGDSIKISKYINQRISSTLFNPLYEIINLAQLMEKQGDASEMNLPYLTSITENANSAIHMIANLAGFFRIGVSKNESEIENLNLNSLLSEIEDRFADRFACKGIPLFVKTSMSERESTVFGCKEIMFRVVDSLLDNAVKYTSSGFVELTVGLEKGRLAIKVKDTGCGIDQADHSRIFAEFTKLDAKENSLGLGLTIAKMTALQIGGDISVESVLGEGTVFTLSLPYNPVFLDRDSVNDETAVQQRPFNVLVAEDEEINFLYLETVLTNLSVECKLIHAKNGEEAVNICEKLPDIDLVLMDLKMPVMNGFIATEKIKKIRPDLMIVIQSAYSASIDRKRAVQVGCDDFLTKPISKEALSEIVFRCKTNCLI